MPANNDEVDPGERWTATSAEMIDARAAFVLVCWCSGRADRGPQEQRYQVLTGVR